MRRASNKKASEPGSALEQLLTVLGEPAFSVPAGLETCERQLSYVGTATGLVYVRVTLGKGWQDRMSGYYLVETDGGPAALCPRTLRGYTIYTKGARHPRPVGRESADNLCGTAWQVFPSLPRRYGTPRAAVWYFLCSRGNALLALFAALLIAMEGAAALLSLPVRQALWEVAAGALPWSAVLPPFAAVLAAGAGVACLAVCAARRLEARIGEHGAAALLRRAASQRAPGKAGRLADGCTVALRYTLLLLAAGLLSLLALAWLGLRGSALMAAPLLLAGVLLAVACGLLFRRTGRLPAGFLSGAASLWLAAFCGEVWAFRLSQADALACLTVLLPPAAALLLLARAAPAFGASARETPTVREPPPPPNLDRRPPLLHCDGSLALDEAEAGPLAPITLRIAPGEKVGIYGPAGAGKTTLLRLLSGELEPTRGAAYCGEKDCAGVQTDSLRYWVRWAREAEASAGETAILLADHITRRSETEAALTFPGTAVLASARKELLAGCGRLYRLSGGTLREEAAYLG